MVCSTISASITKSWIMDYVFLFDIITLFPPKIMCFFSSNGFHPYEPYIVIWFSLLSRELLHKVLNSCTWTQAGTHACLSPSPLYSTIQLLYQLSICPPRYRPYICTLKYVYQVLPKISIKILLSSWIECIRLIIKEINIYIITNFPIQQPQCLFLLCFSTNFNFAHIDRPYFLDTYAYVF